ncbi:MAG: helicase, partial [Flavobacterium psychrophilum]
FLNALQKLPGIIAEEEKKCTELEKDKLVLREIAAGEWKKEKQLSDLKTELAAVERNIQLSLKDNEDHMDSKTEQSHIKNSTVISKRGL